MGRYRESPKGTIDPDLIIMANIMFGARVKRYREVAGLSQRQLAEACGYSDRTSIARIEAGHYGVEITVAHFIKMTKALGVRHIQLIGGLHL